MIKSFDNCVIVLRRAGETRAVGIGMRWLLPFVADVEDWKRLEEMGEIA